MLGVLEDTMNCGRCQTPTLDRKERPVPDVYVGVSGSQPYVATALVCRTCGDVYWEGTELHSLSLRIATEMLGDNRELATEEVVFLRKTLGMLKAEFAAFLGTSIDEVRRWETTPGSFPIAARTFLRDRYAEELSKDAVQALARQAGEIGLSDWREETFR